MDPFSPSLHDTTSLYNNLLLPTDILAEDLHTVTEGLTTKALRINKAPAPRKKFLKAVEEIINKIAICTENYALETTRLKNYLYRPSENIFLNDKLKASYYHLFCHYLSADIEKAVVFFHSNLKAYPSNLFHEETFESNLQKASKIGQIAKSCFYLLPKDLKSKITEIHSLVQNPQTFECEEIEKKIFNSALNIFKEVNFKAEIPSLDFLIHADDLLLSSGTTSTQAPDEEENEIFVFEDLPSSFNSQPSLNFLSNKIAYKGSKLNQEPDFLPPSSEAIPIPGADKSEEEFVLKGCPSFHNSRSLERKSSDSQSNQETNFLPLSSNPISIPGIDESQNEIFLFEAPISSLNPEETCDSLSNKTICNHPKSHSEPDFVPPSSDAIPVPYIHTRQNELFLFEDSPSFLNSQPTTPQPSFLSMHFINDKLDTAKT